MEIGTGGMNPACRRHDTLGDFNHEVVVPTRDTQIQSEGPILHAVGTTRLNLCGPGPVHRPRNGELWSEVRLEGNSQVIMPI